MDYYRLTPDFCRKLRKAGFEVQASIYPTPFDLFGTRSGVTIQLSDYLYLPTLGGKPIKVETENNLRLKGGSRWYSVGSNDVHYGAQTVEITFRGVIIVKLADGRRYILQREKMGTDNLGVRFINRKPEIEITVGDYTIIKSLKVADYEF